MAFDVLVNLLTNLDNIRKDIATIKQDSANLTDQQIQKARSVEDEQEVFSQRRIAQQRAYQATRDQEIAQQKVIAAQDAAIQAKRDQYAKANLQGAALASATAYINKQEAILKVEAAKLAPIEANLIQIENTTRAIDIQSAALDRQFKLQTRGFQDSIRANKQQIAQLQNQQQTTQSSRQKFAGVGLALAGGVGGAIPGAQAAGSLIASFAFGGPEAAAITGIGLAVGGIVTGLTDAVGLLKDATIAAFDFSQKIELGRLSTAGLLATSSRIVDGNGKSLQGQDKFNAALEISASLQQKLLALTNKTNITFEEGNLALQSSLGLLTSRGVNENDALQIIVRLTAAAKSLGLEGAKAAQQVNSLLSGQTTRSRLAQALKGGVDLNQISGLSGDQLGKSLLDATSQIDRAVQGTSSLLKTGFENIRDNVLTILAKSFDDVFKGAGEDINNILNNLIDGEGKLTKIGEELKQAFQGLFAQLLAIGKQVFTVDNLKNFVSVIDSGVRLATQLLSTLQSISKVTFGVQGLTGALKEQATRSEFVNADIKGPVNAGPVVKAAQTLQTVQTGAFFNPADVNPSATEKFAATSGVPGTGGDLQAAGGIFARARDKGLSVGDATKAANDFISALNTELAKKRSSVPILGRLFELTQDEKTSLIAAAQASIDSLAKAQQDEAVKAQDPKKAPHVGGLNLAVNFSSADLKNPAKLNELQTAYNKLLAASQDDLDGVFVRIGNVTLSAQQGVDKLGSAISSLKSKIDVTEAANERLNTLNVELAAGKQRIDQLTQEQGELEKLKQANLDASITEESAYVKVNSAAKTKLENDRQSVEQAQAQVIAQTAVVAAIEAEQAAYRKKNNIPVSQPVTTGVGPLKTTVELRQQEIKLEGDIEALKQKQLSLSQAEIDNQQRIRQDLGDVLSKQQAITASVEQQQAAADARSFQAQGVSGAISQQLSLQKETSDTNKLLVTQQEEIKNAIGKAQGIAQVSSESGDDKAAEAANQLIVSLQKQLQLIVSIRQEDNATLLLRLQTLQIQRESEQLVIQQGLQQSQLGLVQAQVNAGVISSVDAYAQIRDINNQLIAVEQKKQNIEVQRQALLNAEKAQILASLATGNLTYEQQQTQLLRLEDINNQLDKSTTLINVSKTAVQGLVDAFGQIGTAITKGTQGLAQFFNEIDLPKIGSFLSSVSKLSSGFQQIFSKNKDGQNFFSQLGSIFSSTKSSAGGGLIGSIAGGLSTAFAAAGPIGSAISGVIGIFSGLKSLFSNAAKEMADNITKSVQSINTALSENTINISQAITQLNTQLQQAYQLENTKGGADSGAKLVDQITQQIDQLKKQQTDTLNSFNESLALQKLGTGFNDFTTAIQDAITKINAYTGAGGSVDQAQQYLNNIISSFKTNLAQTINTAQQSAIQQAQQLLQLQQQIVDLDTQHQENVQGILSQGLASRTLTFGQQKAQQLNNENNQYNTQHQTLQDQLDTTTSLLNINKQVLDGTVDINNAESLKLALLTLQTQQAQQQYTILAQQMTLLKGLSSDANGNFILSPDLYNKLSSAGLFTGTGLNVGNGGMTVGNVTLNIVVNGNNVSGVTLGGDTQAKLLDALQGVLIDQGNSVGGSNGPDYPS